MHPAAVWSLWTGEGLIDLIKMKAIDSVMNLQQLIYIIQKAELHLSADINGNSSPLSTHAQTYINLTVEMHPMKKRLTKQSHGNIYKSHLTCMFETQHRLCLCVMYSHTKHAFKTLLY